MQIIRHGESITLDPVEMIAIFNNYIDKQDQMLFQQLEALITRKSNVVFEKMKTAKYPQFLLVYYLIHFRSLCAAAAVFEAPAEEQERLNAYVLDAISKMPTNDKQTLLAYFGDDSKYREQILAIRDPYDMPKELSYALMFPFEKYLPLQTIYDETEPYLNQDYEQEYTAINQKRKDLAKAKFNIGWKTDDKIWRNNTEIILTEAEVAEIVKNVTDDLLYPVSAAGQSAFSIKKQKNSLDINLRLGHQPDP